MSQRILAFREAKITHIFNENLVTIGDDSGSFLALEICLGSYWCFSLKCARPGNRRGAECRRNNWIGREYILRDRDVPRANVKQ